MKLLRVLSCTAIPSATAAMTLRVLVVVITLRAFGLGPLPIARPPCCGAGNSNLAFWLAYPCLV